MHTVCISKHNQSPQVQSLFDELGTLRFHRIHRMQIRQGAKSYLFLTTFYTIFRDLGKLSEDARLTLAEIYEEKTRESHEKVIIELGPYNKDVTLLSAAVERMESQNGCITFSLEPSRLSQGKIELPPLLLDEALLSAH